METSLANTMLLVRNYFNADAINATILSIILIKGNSQEMYGSFTPPNFTAKEAEI